MWLNNTNLLYHGQAGTYRLLAHRGLAQTFDESEAGWDSNTAAMIDEPRHGYIENTIPSMRAAFDLGADAVEFDVKLSKDGLNIWIKSIKMLLKIQHTTLLNILRKNYL